MSSWVGCIYDFIRFLCSLNKGCSMDKKESLNKIGCPDIKISHELPFQIRWAV